MPKIRCSQCQDHNDPSSLFCTRCGARLRRFSSPLPSPAFRAFSDGVLTPELVRHLSGRGGERYAAIFRRMYPSYSVSLKPSWNWAAALVPFWMLFRGLYLEWAALVALGFAFGRVCSGLAILFPIAQGLFGNAIYFLALERHVRRCLARSGHATRPVEPLTSRGERAA